MKRIDAIFDVEREINGRPTLERLAERALRVAPLVADLEIWMRTERTKLSRHSEVAKAMDYMLKRWDAFARFLSDGRICRTNNAAERELRGIALGRKAWLFAGSDRGGERAAVMYTLYRPPSSTTLTRRPGLPMSSPDYLIIRPSGSTICCLRTGSGSVNRRPLDRSDHTTN